jgi:hypothetical protein
MMTADAYRPRSARCRRRRSEKLAQSMSDYLITEIDGTDNISVEHGVEVVGRDEWGYIITGPSEDNPSLLQFESTVPGVFAVGDAARLDEARRVSCRRRRGLRPPRASVPRRPHVGHSAPSSSSSCGAPKCPVEGLRLGDLDEGGGDEVRFGHHEIVAGVDLPESAGRACRCHELRAATHEGRLADDVVLRDARQRGLVGQRRTTSSMCVSRSIDGETAPDRSARPVSDGANTSWPSASSRRFTLA